MKGMNVSNEFFHSAFEAAPSAMVIVDKKGNIIVVNSQTEKLFGYGREELIGRSVEILVPQRYRDKHPLYREDFYSDPQTRPMGMGRDLYGLHKNGSEFLIEIGLNPIQTENGMMVLSAIVDITERKRAEKALEKYSHDLERSEEKFRLVVESAPNAMVMINQAGRIVLVNAQTEKLFGYPRGELIGQSIEILIPLKFRNQHPAFRNDFFADPQARPMGVGRDLFGMRKDGSEVPIEIGLNPIHTADGMLVLSAIVDITERKRAERVHERYTAELARSNEELQNFAYIASHDLQEPLRKIQSFGDRLKTKFNSVLNDEGNDYIVRMQNASIRMSHLIEDLLTFSRVTSQAKPFEAVDLNAVLGDVISDLEVQTAKTGGEIIKDELTVIDADYSQMRQLFQNLISNALKFHGEKPPKVKIRGRFHDQNDTRYYQVFIEDNGIGFQMKYTDKIFTIFQRLHARSEYEGSGIGLAVCKKIVQRHSGFITAQSTEGAGSTFIVTLPVMQSKKEQL